jgi:hypothetical protein
LDSMPAVDLDLDVLAHEAQREPFRIKLEGEVFELASPEEADWRSELSGVESMKAFLEELMGSAQYERFASHRVPGWKVSKIIEGAVAHYGVETGESAASTKSRPRTRKR